MLLEKIAAKFGNGAKIDCSGALIGQKAHVLIRKNGARLELGRGWRIYATGQEYINT